MVKYLCDGCVKTIENEPDTCPRRILCGRICNYCDKCREACLYNIEA